MNPECMYYSHVPVDRWFESWYFTMNNANSTIGKTHEEDTIAGIRSFEIITVIRTRRSMHGSYECLINIISLHCLLVITKAMKFAYESRTESDIISDPQTATREEPNRTLDSEGCEFYLTCRGGKN